MIYSVSYYNLGEIEALVAQAPLHKQAHQSPPWRRDNAQSQGRPRASHGASLALYISYVNTCDTFK